MILNKDVSTFDAGLPEYKKLEKYPFDLTDYKFSESDIGEDCYHMNNGNWGGCKASIRWNDNYGYTCKAYYYGNFCDQTGTQVSFHNFLIYKLIKLSGSWLELKHMGND